MRSITFLLLWLVLYGCGDDTSLPDARTLQDSGSDASFVDSSLLDAPVIDDAQSNDSSLSDGRVADAERGDANVDSSRPDANNPDANVPSTASAPSCDTSHTQILRLYQAFFGRRPDPAGANYWIGQYQSGVGLEAIQASFGASQEFIANYMGLSDDAFLTKVYQNVLGRGPDASGLAYWKGELQAGRLTRVGLIVAFSNTDEFRNRVPYPSTAFCDFVSSRSSGYALTQVAPHAVLARNGDVYALFVDIAAGGSLRVPKPEPTATPACSTRTIPTVIKRVPGHFGGTAAINGNWHNCDIADYFAGYSISAGVVLGAALDHRRGYIGATTTGALTIGHYQDTNYAVPAGLHEAVSGITLVLNGAPWAESTTASTDPTFTNRHPRTAAGVTSAGYLILTVVDGRMGRVGMNGTETANLMVSLGSQRAIMLDGGGSSALFIKDRGIVNTPSDAQGTRSVGNQLVFDADTDWVR